MNLYDNVIPHLSPKAAEAYNQLVECGFDSDLALTLIEHLLGEHDTYSLEEADEEE